MNVNTFVKIWKFRKYAVSLLHQNKKPIKIIKIWKNLLYIVTEVIR
ncbi:hypothetical protein HNL05_37 [Bacteroides phage HNL05]|nr:hypothetical protein HNL05_37 [Bacteroides phage HNL05]